VIVESRRPEFLSASGTGTMLGWAFRDAAAPASCTTGSAGAANHQDPVATSHLNGGEPWTIGSQGSVGASAERRSHGALATQIHLSRREIHDYCQPTRRPGRLVRVGDLNLNRIGYRRSISPACRARPGPPAADESVMAPSPPDTQSP
jgi:hypothetical protein